MKNCFVIIALLISFYGKSQTIHTDKKGDSYISIMPIKVKITDPDSTTRLYVNVGTNLTSSITFNYALRTEKGAQRLSGTIKYNASDSTLKWSQIPYTAYTIVVDSLTKFGVVEK